MAKLQGRSALITGASQGLGREIAATYLREGASVVICARDGGLLDTTRNELAPLVAAGSQLLAWPCDVSKPEQVRVIYEHALATIPELDILVNTAGVYGPKGAVEDNYSDEWVQAIEIDLYGAV